MGVVVYSNESKSKLLGVPVPLLERFGAVSEEVARAMAEGVKDVACSDIGVAVTGIAGPDGGTAEKPVGTVFVAIADKFGCEVMRHLFPGDRTRVRNMTVEAVFDRLEQKLEQHQKQAK
jgi:PncC family amidohydrolase